MKTVFSDFGGFPGIGVGIGIYAVRQKTFVDVKEEGTEAAAATVVAMADVAEPLPPQNPFMMIVNRPFLFLIEDNQTGTILFLGTVFDPPAD
jgi:serpin B